MGSLTAFNTLRDRLKALKSDFDSATAAGITDGQRRIAAHQSLYAVIDFMNEDKQLAGLDFGLVPLLIGISEASQGRPPTWWVGSVQNHPGTSDMVRLLRARCAGVMLFLINRGEKPVAAATYIRGALPANVRDIIFANGRRSENPVRAQINAIISWHAMLNGKSTRDTSQRPVEEIAALTATMNDAHMILSALPAHKPRDAAREYLNALGKAPLLSV